jgi:hypothetical protein
MDPSTSARSDKQGRPLRRAPVPKVSATGHDPVVLWRSDAMGACYDRLTYLERLTISDGRYRRFSVCAIARTLNRAPSTVSRELKRLGPYWQGYSPAPALTRALAARRESRVGSRKLVPGSPLFGLTVTVAITPKLITFSF